MSFAYMNFFIFVWLESLPSTQIALPSASVAAVATIFTPINAIATLVREDSGSQYVGSMRSSSSTLRIRHVTQSLSAKESQKGIEMYGDIARQLMKDCWQRIIPVGDPLSLEEFLIGLGYLGNIMANVSLAFAQEWEARC